MVDRRIQKTKKYLSEALVALILEKGYDNVTVQDIIDKANAGRSTFYAHYENKEQLFLDSPQNLGMPIFEKGEITENSQFNFLKLFNHITENMPLAKAVLGKKSGDIFVNHIKNQITWSIQEHYKTDHLFKKLEPKMLSFYAEASAAAIVSLTVSWVEDNMPLNNETMSKRCQLLVTTIFATLLNSEDAVKSK
jgi:hypothetical protein